jgi:hypothetical protein
MRTISILLYKRPELFEQTMTALIHCQDLSKFDLLTFSIDGGHEDSVACAGMANACAKLFAKEGLIDTKVVAHSANIGVADHPLWVLTHAFEELGADLNVNLEDDAVPKNDLLRMALWWEEFGASLSPESIMFCGCNHRSFGKKQQMIIPEDEPSLVAESPYICSPFCWATTKENWPLLKNYWNFKTEAPMGFDLSASMAMRMEKKVSVHPILSRCQNIGRSKGEHETEETFDKTQLNLIYQEEDYEGEYKLVARLDREDLNTFDDWMLPEVQKMRGEPVTQWTGRAILP